MARALLSDQVAHIGDLGAESKVFPDRTVSLFGYLRTEETKF
jgi:hypothetical protein